LQRFKGTKVQRDKGSKVQRFKGFFEKGSKFFVKEKGSEKNKMTKYINFDPLFL
jgi:hypothetical protein